MTIRRAQPDDCESLLSMAAKLATSFVVQPDAFRNAFRQCLSDDSSEVLVAEADSLLVGYLLGFDHVAFFANGRVAGVEEIYVTPSHRHKGIGKALMREFEKWAESRNSAQVVVCTRRASEFYLSVGYEQTALCFRRVLEKNAGWCTPSEDDCDEAHRNHP